MSREWTVHAQLTISQPIDGANSEDTNPTRCGQCQKDHCCHGGGKEGGGGVQNSEKPITIVYQWSGDDLNLPPTQNIPRHNHIGVVNPDHVNEKKVRKSDHSKTKS